MTQTQLLGSLRAVELRLSTSEVSAFFRGQNETTRTRFVQESLQISVVVAQLTNAQLDDIAGKLETLSP